MPSFSREAVATIQAGNRRIVVEGPTATDHFALVLRLERQDGGAPSFIRVGLRRREGLVLLAAIQQALGEPAPSPPSPVTAPVAAAEDLPPKCAGQARRRHASEAVRVAGVPPQSWVEMQSKGT